ncbi:MAG: hypothetical protein JXA89_12195 [Anaerolineae bacterium]|nr:hypothetical protein [Anaerolineae bacterium]
MNTPSATHTRFLAIITCLGLTLALSALALISLALALGTLHAAESPPSLQSIYPAHNAFTATLSTTITVSYDQPISAATVAASPLSCTACSRGW